jgi:predicted amidophosphoribosyltransferase
LSGLLDIPLAPYHLMRIRPTPSQFMMQSKQERRENLKGAFAVRDRHPFGGKQICLLDDVVTTGSTLGACADALIKSGAKRVVALTVARTVHW